MEIACCTDEKGTGGGIGNPERLRMINQGFAPRGAVCGPKLAKNGLFRLDAEGGAAAWWNHERLPRHLQHLPRDY
jgi:hypothetical protein